MDHQSKKRELAFDLLRGTVVFLMILAHSIYFFNGSRNIALSSIEHSVNLVVFTTFLFISGAVISLAYFRNNRIASPLSLIKRLLVLWIGYYLLAIVSAYDQLQSIYVSNQGRFLLDIITFKNVPSYTEFFPVFIFFSLLVIIAPRLWQRLINSLSNVILVGLIIFVTGYLLYRIPVSNSLLSWKHLLVGSTPDVAYRFPLFQYFIVFAFGGWFGHISHQLTLNRKIKFSQRGFISFMILLGLIFIYYLLTNNLGFGFRRWPPTIGFITVGLTFSLGLLYIFQRFLELKKPFWLKEFLLVLGQNALGLLWAHIFILQLYRLTGQPIIDSVVIFVVAFLGLLVLSLILTAILPFNFKFSLTKERNSINEAEQEAIYQLQEETYQEAKSDLSLLSSLFSFHHEKSIPRKLFQKRRALAVLAILTVLLLALPFASNQIQKVVRSNYPISKTWWNDDFGYRQALVVKNDEPLRDINDNEYISLEFNHLDLVNAKKSDSTGSDLRLVFQRDNRLETLDYFLTDPCTAKTQLTFQAPERIVPGQTLNGIYLYYGDFLAYPEATAGKIPAADPINYLVSNGSEESYPILATVSKNWNLISDFSNRTDSHLTLSLTSNEKLTNPQVSYAVLKTNISGSMNRLTKQDPNSSDIFQSEINLSELSVGSYQAQVTIKDGDRNLSSQRVGFIITYPLYYAWTIDWEGYDVSTSYIDKLAQIADSRNIVQTHFFNPRIYTDPSISPERRTWLTNWVKNRRDTKSNEIALHIHMQYDFVNDAGVTVRKSPDWGSFGDGYAVLSSAYTEDEFYKIVERGLSYFDQNGLGMPVAYRCGGWFCDNQTLRAIDKSGLKVDSSGRMYYRFGTKQLAGAWDLTPTTKPYYPSPDNLNNTSSDHLNLLEIPDNSLDSYSQSADQMINFFKQNYDEKVVKDFRQVTMISHPIWPRKNESQDIERTLDYVNQFANTKDRGPVVFATTSQIYQAYLNRENQR